MNTIKAWQTEYNTLDSSHNISTQTGIDQTISGATGRPRGDPAETEDTQNTKAKKYESGNKKH